MLYHGDMFRPCGGFAQYAIQCASTLTGHPDLPSVQAAAVPCAGWTAWRALVDKLKINKNHTLFISGGAGGVGSFAIQIAKHLGLRTIITTCSEKNRHHVLNLGATHVINYKKENTVQRILEITHGQGVHRGLDCVGYDTDIHVANALGFEGEMVELVDDVRPAHYTDAFMKGLSFHQLSLRAGHRNGPEAEAALRKAGQQFANLIDTGNLVIPVSQTVSIEDVGPALKEILNQRTVGKIVLKNEN